MQLNGRYIKQITSSFVKIQCNSNDIITTVSV